MNEQQAHGTARDGAAGRDSQRPHPTSDGPDSLQRLRREHIERTLGDAGGDVEKAAAVLGLTVRELRRWMRRLRIG